MDQDWSCPDDSLADLLTILRRNFQTDYDRSWYQWFEKLYTFLQSWNSVGTSVKNVERHYDLDEPLFRSFLDSDMHYSCAYFRDDQVSLEEAQQAKCRHIFDKLLLNSGANVLDIGCGWGSLAMYIAEHSDAHVTGITLSEPQLSAARERSASRKLENQVQFQLEDYRDHEGSYDAIVSVGMFEHVGKKHFNTFFNKIKHLLKPDGVALLHTIGTSSPPTPTNRWISKYIFPGGYIPALSEIVSSIESSQLVNLDTEVWRRHYAATLREWNRRFQSVRDRFVGEKGERFCRMWEFYLGACETAFMIGDLVVFQIQLGHSNNSAPLTRIYLYSSA